MIGNVPPKPPLVVLCYMCEVLINLSCKESCVITSYSGQVAMANELGRTGQGAYV